MDEPVTVDPAEEVEIEEPVAKPQDVDATEAVVEDAEPATDAEICEAAEPEVAEPKEEPAQAVARRSRTGWPDPPDKH